MIQCYRDEQGFRRVNPNDVHPLIASYLEQDLQGDPAGAQELLEILKGVKEGRTAEWSGTGNAHTVTIGPAGVEIHNEWDQSLGDAHLTLDQFRGCLEAWKVFVSS